MGVGRHPVGRCPQSTCYGRGTALCEEAKVDDKAASPPSLSCRLGMEAVRQTVPTSLIHALRGSAQYLGNSKERGLEPRAGNVVREGFLEEMAP